MEIILQCTRCKSQKHSSMFNKHPLRADTYCKMCISCTEKQKNYREKHKNAFKKSTQKYYKKNKTKIIKIREKRFNTLIGRLKNILSGIKNRSGPENYDLDIDFLMSLYNNQNGQCALTKLKMSFINDSQFRVDPFMISVDRINPSLGYIKSNVRLVCAIVNYALNEFGETIFGTMCKAYAQNLHQSSFLEDLIKEQEETIADLMKENTDLKRELNRCYDNL
jgi:hypothetical protein